MELAPLDDKRGLLFALSAQVPLNMTRLASNLVGTLVGKTVVTLGMLGRSAHAVGVE